MTYPGLSMWNESSKTHYFIDFKTTSDSENFGGLHDLNKHDNITGLNDLNSLFGL